MRRPPAVSGIFYPSEPAVLRAAVEGFLRAAQVEPGGTLRALVAPHAGYAYSGPPAGAAYRRLQLEQPAPRRVVLLGPSHRAAFRGLALSGAQAWDSPLGSVSLDRAGAAEMERAGLAFVHEAAQAGEHSLEVQLPFLQAVLGDFQLLPLLAGEVEAESLAAALRRALQQVPGSLLLVSSDLSHYLPYRQAQALDARTNAALLSLRAAALDPAGACGYHPLGGLLELAGPLGWKPRTLALCNSGDTAGDRGQVVGYGAWAFEGGRGA